MDGLFSCLIAGDAVAYLHTQISAERNTPLAELTATVDQQPNQTTICISGYLSAEHAESLESAFAELDSEKSSSTSTRSASSTAPA